MKNKIYYLLGSFISSFGDGIQQIAIIWYIYHLTGEALSIGLMIAIYYLPSILLTPFVSVYVDHRDSKNIVVLTDLCRFLIVFIMAVAIFFEMKSSLLFYALQFLLAIFYTIYKPASQSFIKESFDDKDIPFIISKSSSLNEAALIAGTGLAGILLIKLSVSLSFFVNAITFLLGTILFYLMERVRYKQVKEQKIAYIHELKAGWSYINQKEGMTYLLFLSILNSVSIQMTTTMLLPLAKEFRGDSGLYSLFEMSFALGGIIAGLIVTYLLRKYRQSTILITMGGMMLSSYLLSVNQNQNMATVFIFLLGLFTMSHLVTTQTLIQLNTTKEFIGRVVGIRTILASFVKISSALTTGVLISAIGVNQIFSLFSILILFSFLSIRRAKRIYIPEQI